jgi:hypothetical protein
VLWSSSGGALLLTLAADPLPPYRVLPKDWADWWDYDPANIFPGEPKAADWGMRCGRRVLVNYSNPVAFTLCPRHAART